LLMKMHLLMIHSHRTLEDHAVPIRKSLRTEAGFLQRQDMIVDDITGSIASANAALARLTELHFEYQEYQASCWSCKRRLVCPDGCGPPSATPDEIAASAPVLSCPEEFLDDVEPRCPYPEDVMCKFVCDQVSPAQTVQADKTVKDATAQPDELAPEAGTRDVRSLVVPKVQEPPVRGSPAHSAGRQERRRTTLPARRSRSRSRHHSRQQTPSPSGSAHRRQSRSPHYDGYQRSPPWYARDQLRTSSSNRSKKRDWWAKKLGYRHFM
jgi:hypothetical protein